MEDVSLLIDRLDRDLGVDFEDADSSVKLNPDHTSALFVAWARAHLRELRSDLERYHHHLVRHANQRLFKRFILDMMEHEPSWENAMFVLEDYWAKQGVKERLTATCEHSNKSTSILGMAIRLANPSADTRVQHPSVDWDDFPPPHTAGGPSLLRLAFRIASNTSQQTGSHMGQTRRSVYTQISRLFPWITRVYNSSDGATHFHSTEVVFANATQPLLRVVCISVEGEGKDWVDSDNAAMQAVFKSSVRQDKDIFDADDHIDAMNRHLKPGHMNAIFEPTTLPLKGTPPEKAIPSIGTLKFISYGEELRLHEAFDDVQSRALRKPVGKGLGLNLAGDAAAGYGKVLLLC